MYRKMLVWLLPFLCAAVTGGCEDVSDSPIGPTTTETYLSAPSRSRASGECITNPDHRVRISESRNCQPGRECWLLYNALFRNSCSDDAQIQVSIALSVFRGGVRFQTVTYILYIDPHGEEWMCGDGSGDCYAGVGSSDPQDGDFQVKWAWHTCWTWFHPTQGWGCHPGVGYPDYPD